MMFLMMKKDPGLENFGVFQLSKQGISSFCKMISKTVLLNFDHHGDLICHETPIDHLVSCQELNLHLQTILSIKRKLNRMKQNIK